MKNCRNCKKDRKEDDFYFYTSTSGKKLRRLTCRFCFYERKANYIKTIKGKAVNYRSLKKMVKLYPEKHSARQKIKWAVKLGKITRPSECEIKKDDRHSGRLEAHHEDYSKPLEVIWLCHMHHCIIEGKGNYLSNQ